MHYGRNIYWRTRGCYARLKRAVTCVLRSTVGKSSHYYTQSLIHVTKYTRTRDSQDKTDLFLSQPKALLMATLSGLSEPAGALLALCFIKPYLTPMLLQYLLASTGGMMSAVCFLELLPEGR